MGIPQCFNWIIVQTFGLLKHPRFNQLVLVKPQILRLALTGTQPCEHCELRWSRFQPWRAGEMPLQACQTFFCNPYSTLCGIRQCSSSR